MGNARRSPGTRHRPGPDGATGSVELMTMLAVVLMAAPAIIALMLVDTHDTSTEEHAYQRYRQGLDDFLTANMRMCCPEDPTAGSLLANQLALAWAQGGEHTIEPLRNTLPAPEATRVKLGMGWTQEDHPRMVSHAYFKDREPTGKTAGVQHLTPPSSIGPAYLIPRLENVSGQATVDLHYIPLAPETPYQLGPQAQERPWIETTIYYTRTSPANEEDLTLKRSKHTELVGGWHPLLEIQWMEPDWEAAADGLPRIPDLSERDFTLTLTDEELAAERTIQEAECSLDPDCTDTGLDDGAYPQHPFQLDINLHGPGEVATNTTPDEDPPDTLDGLYQLKIEVPRNWTDVEITREDEDANDLENWNTTLTTVTEHTDGSWTITSYLNIETDETEPQDLTGDENAPDGPVHRHTVAHGDTITAPFRFHARPPTLTENTELGFQPITARLEHTTWTVGQQATLTVEMANNPGRIARTLTPHVPLAVPVTPTGGSNEPQGVKAVVGAIFQNGAEETSITAIAWTAPPGTFLDRTGSPEALFSTFGELDTGNWRIEADGARLVWDPFNAQVCGPLEACGVAAEVWLDGRGAPALPQPSPPLTVGLYEPGDAGEYVRWFLRNNWAYHGLPLVNPREPGFGLAMEHRATRAGDLEGSYLFAVPPSTQRLCTQGDVHARNWGQRMEDHDAGRALFAFGPREDGYPHVDNTCPHLPPLEPALQEHNVTLVAQSGSHAGDTPPLRSAGKATVHTVRGLTRELVAGWQNGAAEAHATGPGRASAGTRVLFQVHMESLVHTLAEDGVAHASLKVRVLDPYNAWEDQAWLAVTLIENGGIDVTADDPPQVHEIIPCDMPGDCYMNHRYPEVPCTPLSETGTCADYGFPTTVTVRLTVPNAPLYGTHLFVAEVSWTHAVDVDTEVGETAFIIAPFDVVTADGSRARPATLWGVGWLEDWG